MSTLFATIWAAVGFGSGYVWNDYIMAGVRLLFPEKESVPAYQVVVYDGWLTSFGS